MERTEEVKEKIKKPHSCNLQRYAEFCGRNPRANKTLHLDSLWGKR